MKSVFIASVIAGVLIGSLMGSDRVRAENGQFSPAGACNWANSEDVRPQFQGWLDNYDADAGEHRISCGLTDQGDQSSSTTDDLQVYFIDNNNEAAMEHTIYCNVYSCDLDGDVCNNEGTRYGDASGGNTVFSAYDGEGYLGFTNLNRPAFGYHNVTCNLPAPDAGLESRIYSFYLIS